MCMLFYHGKVTQVETNSLKHAVNVYRCGQCVPKADASGIPQSSQIQTQKILKTFTSSEIVFPISLYSISWPQSPKLSGQ